MKAADTRSTATTARTNSPFFSKSGQQNFFEPSSKKQSFFSKRNNGASAVQAKLNVGKPGDQHEKEADKMADSILQRLTENNTKPEIQRKPVNPASGITPVIQSKSDHCEKEEQQKEKETGEKDQPV